MRSNDEAPNRRIILAVIMSALMLLSAWMPAAHVVAARLMVKPASIQSTNSPQSDQDKALAAKKAQEVFNEAVALFDEGSAESLRRSIEKLKEARLLSHAAGDGKREALSFLGLGRIHDLLGEKQKALEYYNLALPLYRAVDDRRGEATTLNNIGGIYSDLGENQKALEHYNLALPLRRAVGDRSGEASTLDGIGQVYHSLGENQKALEHYNLALPINREVGDRSGEATTLSNIGAVYYSLGENQKALEHYNLALPLDRAVGDRRKEASTLNSIGVAYSSLGEKQKALEHYTLALSLRRAVGDRGGEATTLSNIGAVYDALGEKQKAFEHYNLALPLYRAVGDRRGEATTLNNIGKVDNELGENQKALEHYNLALPIFRAIGYRRGEATALNNIGKVYHSLGENQKALEHYNLALPIHREVGDRGGEGTALNNIGLVYKELGENQKALEHYNLALPISRTTGDRRAEATMLSNLMYLWDDLRRPRLAIFYGKQGVNTYQELRGAVVGLEKETQQTYLKSVEPTYRELSELLIEQGRLAEALQLLNAFKDQQFFDFNPSARKAPAPLALTPREAALIEHYQQTSKRVGDIGTQLETLRRLQNYSPNNEQAAQIKQFESEFKTASDEFLAVLKQAEAEFSQPPSEKDKPGEVGDLREMQSALKALNQSTGQRAVAIYTLIGAENYRALIVTPDSITAVATLIKGEELNKQARQLWGLLQQDAYDPRLLAKRLYDAVFQPIAAKLPPDTTTLLWSLDGNLRYVPMATLYDGKQYLLERYRNVVFTRADRERMTRAVSPKWTGTGFGSANAQEVTLLGDTIKFTALPGVKVELATIFRNKATGSGILDGEVLQNGQFNQTAMLAALKQQRPLVHIASHFAFQPGDEARSFLLLGDGTAFTLSEMKKHDGLFAGVELLTLSACNTAAQQSGANGREIDGFAELAQRLGAGAVMATLWSVADNSTPWLMRDFYQNRQSQGQMTKAAALQQAQLALLNGTAKVEPLPANVKGETKVKVVIVPKGSPPPARDETRSVVISINEADAPAFKRDANKPFAHPYYWAPFILIGNWK